MLKDDFYTLGEVEKEGSTLKAVLHLRPDHPLYQGHFPDRPVVPGACMLQMIKELTGLATGDRLQLSVAETMKFLVLISPVDTPYLRAELSFQTPEPLSVRVKATLLKDNTPCCKFSGLFRIIG